MNPRFFAAAVWLMGSSFPLLVDAFAPFSSRINKPESRFRSKVHHSRVVPTITIDPFRSVLDSRRTKTKGLQLWRRDDEEALEEPKGPDFYDLIVVGSGNGACAFLEQCLAPSNKKGDLKILVLEQGQNFFFTSDITHQNGWSKTYSTGSVYKLHNTVTPSGIPVLSGRACTMGGGGSINYTMIHESSKWLAEHIGFNADYWDTRKEELNKKFKRPDPFDIETPFSKIIQGKAVSEGKYAKANPDHLTGNIPSYQDDAAKKQLYIFPTQFNEHGQRTNSGVSLIEWRDPRLHLKVNREVKEVLFQDDGEGGKDSTCSGVKVKNSKSGKTEEYKLEPETGKLILCGGSASPRLLMRNRKRFGGNQEIGKHVNDHICMPLAVYTIQDDAKLKIGPKDVYESLFAMSELETGNEPAVCNIDFFSGTLDRLAYLASSLYLTFIPFNGLKIWLGRNPFAFTILSNGVRILLSVIIFIANILFAIWDIIRFKQVGTTEPRITTALVKFNAAQEGQYEDDNRDQITLAFFEDEQDKRVAEEAIKQNLKFLSSIGLEPWRPLKAIFRWITKIPYDDDEVARYVGHFSRRTILSEQHLAGGCLFGKVVDTGENDPSQTGKVFGSTNVHVADLSAVPLPRVSTQMTAYLVGHYVGHQLYS